MSNHKYLHHGGEVVAVEATPHRTLTVAAAIITAALLVSFLVVGASRAAFEADTENTGNSVGTAGGIELVDNDGGDLNNVGGVAMFNVDGLLPGDIEESCITVTYNSTTTPNEVRMFTEGLPTVTTLGAPTLAEDLNVKIEVGRDVSVLGPTFGDCTSFVPSLSPPLGVLFDDTLAAFNTAHADVANPLATTWTPNPLLAPVETVRTFKFTVTVLPTADPLAEADDFGFRWYTDVS